MRQPKSSTPRRRNPSRLVALAVLLAAAGCGGGNSLDGSLSEAIDLSFSTVEVKRSPTALQVTYLQSEGREVVARITVATAGLDLRDDLSLDGEYAPGHPRATVTRAVDGEPLLNLPRIQHGTMSLDDEPVVGEPLRGEFSLSFAEGGDLGAGRTLSGSFEAGLVEAR
jgi:hypothetical protein